MASYANLIKRLSHENVQPFKKWSLRHEKSTQIRKEIRELLIVLSGNDLISMISSILTKEEIESLNLKHVECLKKLSDYYKTIKPKERHHFIRPFREANFSRSETINLGFLCSKNLWLTCLNNNERACVGKPKTDEKIINSIEEHMQNLSTVAANRTIKSSQKDYDGNSFLLNIMIFQKDTRYLSKFN